MVSLVDSKTELPICDATIMTRDGDYAPVLTDAMLGDVCGYVGGADRPGIYELTASRAGYETLVMPGVRLDVVSKTCANLATRRLDLKLNPLK